ncbi:Phosphoglucan, water dikinase, chloroplastic [Porphyridium purpureum]|uniref:Phosphoglucan, water dikinase, chloroplastic n=1 Tax=Porphyridium purpureum TaxID=35688 RepID=A0A5J4YYI2_PORPP|nr:Phosphoglucan, water dikinase, chloroplastic [Porphyridium purpureum]|eukprot:POR4379..scf208_2
MAAGREMASEVVFEVKCETRPGQNVGLLGSAVAFGAWDKAKPLILETDPDLYPTWRSQLVQVEHGAHEYKCVLVGDGKILKWETSGPNRVLQLDGNEPQGEDGGEQRVIKMVFGHPDGLKADFRDQSPDDTPVAFSIPESADLSPFARFLVEENAHNKSWRRKLEIIRRLFTDEAYASKAHFQPQDLEQLVIIVIFLTFLKSGQIVCHEDGSHYRPNHHANEARQIEEKLRVLENDSNAFLFRKIYPQLPSYSSEYTASVPLTRIRDIAHRGDIPHEMKQDIKHNLQNKLHRCAGPEDLVTCRRILDQATSGDYSGGFVEQMQIFMRELEEFFNAKGLEDELSSLKDRNEPADESAPIIQKFLDAKQARGPAYGQLEALTELRSHFAHELHVLDDGEKLQRVRLADTKLEEFAFVLLAGINQEVERDALNNEAQWQFGLSCLNISLQNMILSGTFKQEASAIVNDLASVSASAPSLLAKGDLDATLRVRATVERASRLAEEFSALISELYSGPVFGLGRALGIHEHALAVFAEAEIRSNIVFQMSRTVQVVLKKLRQMLKLPPWDVLMPGAATGKVLRKANIESLSDADLATQCILFLESAQGDEDIPAAVKAIVLAHDLPHLSHLGVRARQAACIFVCAEDKETFDALWVAHAAKFERADHFKLTVSAAGKVDVCEGAPPTSAESAEAVVTAEGQASSSNISMGKLDMSAKSALEILKVSAESCGSKCNCAGQLQLLADKSGLFKTPASLGLPFGAFYAAVIEERKAEYQALIDAFESAPRASKPEEAGRLRQYVMDCQVPSSILKAVQKQFDASAKVMVRSSANCEDLENMSGAGLYDSIANVSISSSESVQNAILRVWSSVWTTRASLSRSQYGVPHVEAYMGVLIQEMITSQYSFVLFSQNPVDVSKKATEVYMEIAVGMGETLASAASRGSPYRFAVDRESLSVREICLANYSVALVPVADDALSDQQHSDGLTKSVVDYSKEQLTTDVEFRRTLAANLGKIALQLEESFGCPQDIEGAVVDGQIYLVQTRPMVVGG